MVEIKVPDMECVHCENRIKSALEKMGISCQVKLKDKIVLVEESKIEQAFTEIYDLGFSPEK